MIEAGTASCFHGQMVAFRVDASLEIGSGHVMRCLTLADALRAQGAQCHFLCREHPGNLCELIEARGYPAYRLPVKVCDTKPVISFGNGLDPVHSHWLGVSWREDAATSLSLLTDLSPDWLVVDHYALDNRWETFVLDGLVGSKPRLLAIDDLADRQHVADLLIDQSLDRRALDYRGLVPKGCQILTGTGYALVRPDFRVWREASLSQRACKTRLQQLLINLGGVDKDNVTTKVLEALSSCDLPADLQISVVMGISAPWLESVKAKANLMPWPTEVVCNVNDMARRMVEADFAIGAAGSTSWERCCVGLPTLMIVLANNQREIANALATKGAAFALDMDELQSSLLDRLASVMVPGALTAMSLEAAKLVDGQGTSQVLAAMKWASIHRMRSMQEQDLKRVLAWRNAPGVRRHMYTQRLITPKEHTEWFERASQDPHRHLLIYEQNGLPLGFVKLDLVDVATKCAEWGFYLAPEAGRGCGQELGRCALTYAFDVLGVEKLCGDVLADNARSQRFHERLGFRHIATQRDHFYDGNIYHDVIGFALLAEEWRDLQGT